MVEIQKTLKKLHEARFFLAWMKKAARLTDFEREDFEFYLSAFLSAGRSVTLVLQVEQKDLYDARYGPWETNLPPEDQALMKFMNRQRREEVHLLGADVEAAIEMVPITQIETQPGTDPRYGIFQWWGEPDVPPPQIGMKVHYLTSGAGHCEVHPLFAVTRKVSARNLIQILFSAPAS